MTPQRVTLITLGVADLAKSTTFYETLGWVKSPRGGDEVTFFQMHGSVLGLYPLPELAKDQTRDVHDLGTGAMTLAQNWPSEAEVDTAFEAMVVAGGTAVKTPEKVFWGGYSGYVADPDGHIWEIAYNPFWPLANDGSLTLPEPK